VPKVNVYLPGWLADAVRESPISISAVCQRALTDELAAQPAGEVTPLLTNRAQEVLRRATQAGMASGDLALLAGLDGEGGNLALVILGAVGVDRARLRERVAAAAKRRGGPDLPGLVADPYLRETGFFVQAIAAGVLWLAALIGAVASMLHG